MELTMRERQKLTTVKAQAYLKAGKAKKSAMLDDFCESTGYCRRHAAHVLHQAGQRYYLLTDCLLVADPGKHIHRYRASRCGPAVQQALITIRAASTFLGPVRLAAGMPLFVENLVTHGHLCNDEKTRRLLLRVSPATMGRFLAGERKMYRLHGISHTRSTPLRGRIPIQTCMGPPWILLVPWPWTWWVMMEGRRQETSTGPSRSQIGARDGPRQEPSGQKQRSMWSLPLSRASAGTRGESSPCMQTMERSS